MGLVSVEITGDFIKNQTDPILVFKEKKGKTKASMNKRFRQDERKSDSSFKSQNSC